MNDIKRYNCVANDHDAIQPDNDGEFVKFEDYEKRVNGQLRLLEVSGRYNEKLEKRIAELETNIHNIMYENMTLNVKVVGFERKTQEILDAITEGVE